MFKKINLPILDVGLESLRGQKLREFPNFIEYEVNRELLGDLSFKLQPDNINLTEITPPGVMPHKDAWPVGLNFYINAGDDSTYYWKLKSDNDRDSLVRPTGFAKAELQFVNSFKAKTNEWYLLDTKKIHSVEMTNTKRI